VDSLARSPLPLGLPRLGRVVAGVTLALVTLGASPDGGAAQTSHHWADQFGSRSTLLNGTVIAGVTDMGAVFYNPGRLAQLDRPGYLLTAEAFELNRVTLDGGLEDNLELDQTNLRGVPNLVAGVFTFPSLPKHRFAYSLLTRRRDDTDLFLDTELEADLFPEAQGQETFLGSWESLSEVTETWVGMTWSHNVSPRVAVGVTTFGTYVGRQRRIEIGVGVVPTTFDPASLVEFREYRFGSYGLLWKAGLAVDFTPFLFGLSLTTPQINPFGSGTIRYEELLGAPEFTGIEPEVTVFRETDLPLTNRTPLAIGAGVTWAGERGSVHLSGEWYSSVSQYEVMGVDSIRSQTSGEVREYHVMDGLSSVFNYGIGAEWALTNSIFAYGSFARDASAAPDELFEPFQFQERVSNSHFQGDSHHFGSGVTFEASWIDITLGFSIGSSDQEIPNPLAGTGPIPNPPFESETLSVKQRRWRFLFGIEVPFVIEEARTSG
jgi:hypothetical protein